MSPPPQLPGNMKHGTCQVRDHPMSGVLPPGRESRHVVSTGSGAVLAPGPARAKRRRGTPLAWSPSTEPTNGSPIGGAGYEADHDDGSAGEDAPDEPAGRAAAGEGPGSGWDGRR